MYIRRIPIMKLNETVNALCGVAEILLEAAESTENLEKAQEFIEKAQELQEKATEIIDTVVEEDGDAKDKKEESKEAEKKDEVKETLTETVNFLYSKAILCESATDAVEYVVKAEALQKAIDEIPEEKPEVNDTYKSNIESEDPEMKEMLDLLDGDKEALDLITKDDGGAKVEL
jgi:hypothetical protein